MASRRGRVFRERNERGFSLFIQNLKGVISLFLFNNDTQLSTESLIEARQRLLDASGTLSFLVNDLASGAPNPTGIPTHAIQEPLQVLRDSLTQLINIVSSLIENSPDSDYFDNLDVAYAAPTVIQQGQGPGRKRFDISKDQLEHLRSLFFSWQKLLVSFM